MGENSSAAAPTPPTATPAASAAPSPSASLQSAPAAVTPPSPTPVASANPTPQPEPTAAPVAAPATVDAAAPVKPAEGKPDGGDGKAEGEAKPDTVIGAALTPPEKPAEPKPAEGEKKPDAKAKPEGQSAEPAPPPAYEAFKLPDGLTADADRLGQFTTLLGELETTGKVDHAAMQGFGQKLVDFHVAEVQRTVNDIHKAQQLAFEKRKTEWKDEFNRDPVWGGNRAQTTVDSALKFIRTHGGTESEQAEFRKLMEWSGLGNHPVMIRFLSRAGQAMSEPRPLVATTPVQAQPASRVERMYGRKAS